LPGASALPIIRLWKPRQAERAGSNPPEALIVESVPDLRIIDDALWEAVKARQAEIDAKPGVQAIKESRF
jgi:hypothetical protein